MTYDDKYPNAPAGSRSGVMQKTARMKPCKVCDTPTMWRSSARGVYLCCNDCWTLDAVKHHLDEVAKHTTMPLSPPEGYQNRKGFDRNGDW